jgi:hypothetical protein
MVEVPKIVHDRLRTALPGRALSDAASFDTAHPDANLLIAFAEQTLADTERYSVLKHLALCEDCRQVIVLALPATDIVAAPIMIESEPDRVTPISKREEKRGWLGSLTRPSLRWAALAAGVVVAASVLLVHPGKLNQPAAPAVSQTATVASMTESPSSSSSNDQVVHSVDATGDTRSNSEKLFFKKQLPDKPKTERGSTPLAAGSNETREIATVTPSIPSGLMPGDETQAIERAKPALPLNGTQYTEANGPQATQPATGLVSAPVKPSLAPNVTWEIKAGTLKRSLDNGQNWQEALRADHPLSCYASHGQDVWTGGQAGTIFRSVDGGATWVQVKPPVKDHALSTDITRIEILSDVNGTETVVISTNNNERWSSVDAGTTWQKN